MSLSREQEEEEEEGTRRGGGKREQGGFISVTLTRNPFSEHLCASLSRFEHWELQNTVNYQGKFQIHANGVGVVKLTWLKSAAWRQKLGAQARQFCHPMPNFAKLKAPSASP